MLAVGCASDVPVHMNGRLYDATLGRFISADPHIQAGSLSQNYNRYSYVLNNPMKYTDPSGYIFKKAFKKITRAIKKAFKKAWQATVGAPLRAIAKVPWLNAIAHAAACTFGGPVGCAAYAAGSTYAVTGDFKAALTSGAVAFFTAKASTYIGDNVGTDLSSWAQRGTRAVAHGVVGGTAHVIQGGKFGHGFGSSFFTKLGSGRFGPNRLIGSSIAALVGGTASKIGGGKFSNGATTAAIQYLYNEAGDRESDSPEAGDYVTESGDTVSLQVNEYGGLHDANNTFYTLTTDGTVMPLASGAAESVCPECYFIGGGVAAAKNSASVGKYLFGKGGKLNSNRYLRIGIGRGPGGRKVFRISGKLIPKSINKGHIDLKDLGPWE